MSSEKTEERFFFYYVLAHTHTLRLRLYARSCVCVCERFPIVLQTLHLIEHSIGEWRTEVTIIISLSLLSRQWSHYTSQRIQWKMRMMMIIVRVSPFVKAEGISAHCHRHTHTYIHTSTEQYEWLVTILALLTCPPHTHKRGECDTQIYNNHIYTHLRTILGIMTQRHGWSSSSRNNYDCWCSCY